MSKRDLPVAYEATGLDITGDLSAEQYEQLLAALGQITKGHQWWVGDGLVYGETHFADTFSQAAEALKLEPHTLTNYRWVADSVARSRRRDDLSWSHHAEVARLTPSQQTAMLREAAKRGWGVREIRDAVAVKYPQPGRAEKPEPHGEMTQADEALINRRLEGLAVALDDARAAGERWHEHVDLEDVQWLYRVAVELMRGGRR